MFYCICRTCSCAKQRSVHIIIIEPVNHNKAVSIRNCNNIGFINIPFRCSRTVLQETVMELPAVWLQSRRNWDMNPIFCLKLLRCRIHVSYKVCIGHNIIKAGTEFFIITCIGITVTCNKVPCRKLASRLRQIFR